jgi:endoglucanase
VTSFQSGEWMQYTLDVAQPGSRTIIVQARGGQGGTLSLTLNGGVSVQAAVPAGAGWQAVRFPGLALLSGANRIVLKAERCADCEVRSLEVVGS